MTEKETILNRLLDKYENSKHLLQPGTSRRRVILRVEKKELPEYYYENPQIRDDYNLAARKLEQEGLIELEWLRGRQVMMVLSLNLSSECLLRAYRLVNRLHPAGRARQVAALTSQMLSEVSTPWIAEWRDELCTAAEDSYRVPSYCRQNMSFLRELLTAMMQYDSLPEEGITMRAFSIRCYQDSKRFERCVQDEFLRVAVQHDAVLKELCALNDMSAREQLDYLGIYPRTELYEMAGPCVLFTEAGTIDFRSAEPYGLALSGTLTGRIRTVDHTCVSRITFIENKTSYDEYLLREKGRDELVFYCGGFLSPQKCRFVHKLMENVTSEVDCVFWADIDLGGFLMFEQLQAIVPDLRPFRMGAEYVERLRSHGLERKNAYLSRLQDALETHRFPLFEESIHSILRYKVTIEQETFLLGEDDA